MTIVTTESGSYDNGDGWLGPDSPALPAPKMTTPSWASTYSGYGPPDTSTYAYNPTGDARAVGVFGGFGGFGGGLQSIQRFDPNANSWTDLAAPHSEERGYQWAGLNSPEYATAFNDQLSHSTLSPLEQMRLSTPGAIGQAISRPDLSQFSSLGGDQNLRELTFDQQAGGQNLGITPEQQKQIDAQISSSTPSAQSARAHANDSPLGGLGQLAALAAIIYSGGSLAGLWGGMGGAGALGGAELMGPAMESGAFGTTGLGALTGAGETAMNLYPELGQSASAFNFSSPYGILDATGALSGTGASMPATLGQTIGQVSGALDATGAATGTLMPGINSMYDFSTGTQMPAISDASGNLNFANSLATPSDPSLWDTVKNAYNTVKPGLDAYKLYKTISGLINPATGKPYPVPITPTDVPSTVKRNSLTPYSEFGYRNYQFN